MFKKIINWFKNLGKEKTPAPIPSKPGTIPSKPTTPVVNPPVLTIPETTPGIIYTRNKKELWYPMAIKTGEQMSTRGSYAKGYPMGAVVHFTAGRSRDKKEGGTRDSNTHKDRGLAEVKSTVAAKTYAFFIIDRSGNVYQNFPLNRYGNHAGESKWPGLGSSVSTKLVGIEIQNAGKLSSTWNNAKGQKVSCPEGKLAAWFTRPDLGDAFFDKATECRYSANNENIQAGWYHKYSEAQEKALIELLIWLKINNSEVFDTKYILGHDEVAGPKGLGYWRKNDPGASLSSTMEDFRKKINKEISKRY